ncbi:MAG TPA: hypothetical protein VE662_03265 [Solirubrobacterales bacterium]|jgi:NAD-dependent dihydropyrimidine dehydrogenase PreA subunit|nr:hypothetical protein [Solirubrobacterales bacterium]
MPGLFIDVELDPSIREQPEMARKLEDACPVDIYRDAGGRVEIVEDNLDECVLCELCIQAAPKGTVRVRKLYDGSVLES